MRMLKISLVVLLLALQIKLWFGDTGVYQQKKTHQKIKELLLTNEQLAETNQRIELDINALKQKREAVEAKARTELGMIRDGEHFFHFKDKI